MSFNLNLLAHMRAINECLPKFNARAEMKFTGMRLELRARGRYYEFFPQYALVRNGKVTYSPMLTADVTHFIGWRHYFNRQWELSNDKLAFKRYFSARGLLVPQLFNDLASITTDVIVKRVRSSFSEGIDGPFRADQVRAENRTLRDGEFYEQFIAGDIAKIWYWESKPICMEARPMTTVTGDGRATLRELIDNAKVSMVPVDLKAVDAVVRYQGHSLDSVVPAGVSVLIDFRYISSFHRPSWDNPNVIDKYRGTPVWEQLEKAGPLFWEGIPVGVREQTLYAVDAIIDRQQQVYFLEMNSNPVVPPDAYVHILEGLFGPPVIAPSQPLGTMAPPIPQPGSV